MCPHRILDNDESELNKCLNPQWNGWESDTNQCTNPKPINAKWLNWSGPQWMMGEPQSLNGLDHKSMPSKSDGRFCKSHRPGAKGSLSSPRALFICHQTPAFVKKITHNTLSFWARCISHSKNFQSSRQNPSYISFLKPPKSLPPITNEIEISAEERTRRDMDLSDIARKLGFSESKPLLLRKAQELRRLCDVHFDSSIIGIVSISPSIESILLFSFVSPSSISHGFVCILWSVQGEVCKGIICLEIAATRFLSSR